MNKFRFLPQSLKVMFVSQLAAPIVVILYAAIFFNSLKFIPPWHLSLMAIAYLVMPVIVCRFLVNKSPKFIYVVMGQCVLLFVMAFIPATNTPDFLFYTHYTLVLIMVVMALMMINKDLLFPFIFEEQRGFRRAPRVEINHPVKLLHPNGKDVFNLIIDDCSLSGMAIYGNAEELDGILPHLKRGLSLYLQCSVQKQKFELPMTFQWQSVSSHVARIGFRANDAQMMEQFFKALGPKATQHGSGIRLRQAWAKKPARRLMNYVLAICMLAVMTLPPLMVSENRAAVAAKFDAIQRIKNSIFGGKVLTNKKQQKSKKKPKDMMSH